MSRERFTSLSKKIATVTLLAGGGGAFMGISNAHANEPLPPAPTTDVAGLDSIQLANADAIVKEGKRRGLSEKAMVIAVATANQESKLYNRASDVVPESKQYPHQGSGSDHDSAGLFQQTQHWGPTNQIMNPQASAGLFYEKLVQLDINGIPVTVAAQEVQESAYPEAYADDEWVATQAVKKLK